MRKHIAHILFLVLCFASFGAFAEDDPAPAVPDAPPPAGFHLICKAYDLEVTFTSPTNNDFDDNMTATMESGGVTEDLHIPAGGYSTFNDYTTGKSGVCEGNGDKVEAYRVSKDSFILFVAADRHPNVPDVVAFLFDTKTFVLRDVKDLGMSKDDNPGVVPTSDGFKLRMVKDHITGITCDCSASLLEGWMKVSVEGGKIRAGWMRD